MARKRNEEVISEPVEDIGISARIQKKRRDAASKSIEHMTIAERLTLRAGEQFCTATFESEDGPIEVEMRIPTLAEYDFLATYNVRYRAAIATQEAERVTALEDEIYRMMAGLCVDESLDEDFFRSGALSAPDFMTLIQGILLTYNDRISAAKTFRQGKSGAVPNVRSTRKIAS